jgi:hypothetical protein
VNERELISRHIVEAQLCLQLAGDEAVREAAAHLLRAWAGCMSVLMPHPAPVDVGEMLDGVLKEGEGA